MIDVAQAVAEFSQLFPAVYLRFHRRNRKRPPVGPQAWAALQHLQWTGPVTIGEATKHLHRAQSVVSEIVEALEAKGLVTRMDDVRDRRRKLIWLTDAGLELIERQQEVLSRELLSEAFERLSQKERAALLSGMRALSEVKLTPHPQIQEEK
ncbi:MAG: winged helix-turn-helix transcriptional regulator [Polyangiaceae bacterium]|nr:winged helix-turn-helix transcriptional regulator [Myxococcales bacterium]MCB9590871.1 winged helix-turn-helix transcriptional regulator [Polyangiaceae bacterium]